MMTIENESRLNKSLVIDIDFWRDRFVTKNELLTFPSPTIYVIEKNLYFLLRNSTIKDFDRKYKMKPSYLSFDEYGTTILDKMLMYVNNCFSIEDFDFDNVIVPTMQAITTVCQDKVQTKKITELEAIEW